MGLLLIAACLEPKIDFSKSSFPQILFVLSTAAVGEISFSFCNTCNKMQRENMALTSTKPDLSFSTKKITSKSRVKLLGYNDQSIIDRTVLSNSNTFIGRTSSKSSLQGTGMGQSY
jgi:hypothetical protein